MNSISSLNGFIYTRQANTSSAYSNDNVESTGFGDELQGVLGDMYVSSNQYSIPTSERCSISSDEFMMKSKDVYLGSIDIKNSPNIMAVPLVKNELQELMVNIESGLENGKPLSNILQEHIDKRVEQIGKPGATGVGSVDADIIYVNSMTGEVVDSIPYAKENGYSSLEHWFSDGDVVKFLADDFATFIRYRAFPQEDDNPEDVQRLIAEIKLKQNSYNTDRFDMPDGGTSVNADADFINDFILGRIEDKDENAEPIDMFMSAIAKHQGEQYERLENFRIREKMKDIIEILGW